MPPRQSIRDVAREAGVSITTVSRVLNNVDYPVSSELRDRVLNAAERLKYAPNRSAQSLKRATTDVIGLIVRDIQFAFFGQVARGVTEGSLEQGCLAFICNTGRSLEKEFAYHELLWQHRVRGVIVAGGGIADARYTEILSRQIERMDTEGLKVLALAPQGIELPCLSYDHRALGRRMTEYLLKAGHRKIGFIAGPSNVITSQEHVRGYRLAMEEWGVPFDESEVAYGAFSEEGGDLACQQLLNRTSSFTALCAGNDNMAVGAMHTLGERGIRVPDDVSIVGIGNSVAGRYVRPQLTTYDTFRYETGVHAVECLLNDRPLEDSVQDQIRAPFLKPRLIERGSVLFI